MDQQHLIAMLRRCSGVIQAEIRTLQRWTAAANHKRADACRAAIARMNHGPSAPSVRVESILRAAESLSESDVPRPPLTDHASHVAETERSAAFRAALDPRDMPLPTLDLAIAIAPDNAEMAAMNAVAIFNHSTRRS